MQVSQRVYHNKHVLTEGYLQSELVFQVLAIYNVMRKVTIRMLST